MISYSSIFLYALLFGNAFSQTPENNEDLDVQLLEGDIILTNEQQQSFERSKGFPGSVQSTQNAVVRSTNLKWPNGTVPYEMGSFPPDNNAVQAINEAIAEYHAKTCIRLRPRTEVDEDFVRFRYGAGCSSNIGRKGGPQDISIGDGCNSKGTVIHEIFHALGRWHEQSRPDRDSYIKINTANIRRGYELNFDRASTTFTTTQGVPYDFDSVMHYTSMAFSKNDMPTIEPISAAIDIGRLGQREGLSESDVHHIRALYCGVNTQWSVWGTWSSCSRTCNGGTQVRRRICIGDTTCIGTNTDTTTCNNEECPIPPTWSSWSVWSGCTTSCGGGRRSRVRTCLNGTTCEGLSHEFEDCNSQSCPDSPRWSNWSSWSECSQSCQGGFRYRWRYCLNGSGLQDCSGATRQEEECNSQIECSVWGGCSKTCGGGLQVDRTNQNTRSCNEQPCHGETCLQGLNHIGCYRLPPVAGVLKYLEKTSELLTDNPFNRTEPIRKCAQTAHSKGYPYIALSLGLCYSGSEDLENHLTKWTESKTCQNGTGNYFGSAFISDVYRITDSQGFTNSLASIENCGVDYCTNQSLNRTCDIDIHSGSENVTRTSFMFWILILLSPFALYLQ